MSAHAPDSLSPSGRDAHESVPARIPVDLRRLSGFRRLAADYVHDFPAVAPFFAGDPTDRAAWTDAIARTQAHPRDRHALAALIGVQQAHRQAPAAAVAAAARLADDRTVAVLTGQQAGLFGGPLYTLLKALTAVKLARRVEDEHQVPAVAVFWIDAEDHDWNEVRGCTVFDEALTPRHLALAERSGDPVSVGRVRLDDTITALLGELEQILPATDFTPQLLSDLRDAYVPGAGMAEAFGRWLERVLGGQGLVVYDASDPAAKPLARDVFVRELSTAGTTTALAGRAGTDLTDRGYHAQVQPAGDSVALFRLDGGRQPIRRIDGAWAIGDQRLADTDLPREAEQRPDGFSPNVLLRPIVQDAIFPTVCYVAGPNELAYLCQLRGAYEHFGVPMPLMYPRASATLLDAAALRFLTKHAVPIETLQPQDEAALNDLLARQMPAEVEAAHAAAGEAVESSMTRLAEAVPAIDPTLEGAARSTLKRMLHDLETLHGKMVQAAKRRDETLRRQFLRTRALAFPGGEAQERAIGFLWFLNQYGPALIDRLNETLPLDLGQHWILTI